MEQKKEKVLDLLERMEIDAQKLVNRGVRYYAKEAKEVLPFAQLALEVVRELWAMYEIWAKCPIDVEAITFFAEKLKAHYPHTKSICSTIDKELALLIKQRGTNESEEPEETENPDLYEDPEPDAHTCDYSAAGECKICGAIRPGSMLYLEIYGGE